MRAALAVGEQHFLRIATDTRITKGALVVRNQRPDFPCLGVKNGKPTAVGAMQPVPFRARVIVATNRDLRLAMADGKFRRDLFYRLHVIPVYLPPDYDTSGRNYPVLYLFHGWPYDESHWDNLGVDETADAAIQAGTLPLFIIVLPGADPDGIFINTAGGEYSFEGQVVVDLIPHIDATYRTLTTREGRAVGGISRGGVWSLEIALRHADMFGAVGGHSPALKVNNAPDAYDPFKLLDQPRVSELRIYLDAGDTDWALEGTQALHEALDAKGISNQFAVHSGSHSDGLWAASVGEYLAFYAAGW